MNSETIGGIFFLLLFWTVIPGLIYLSFKRARRYEFYYKETLALKEKLREIDSKLNLLLYGGIKKDDKKEGSKEEGNQA